MADTTLETLRLLRDHAAAVLAVIDARGLEGAQHISPKSALADQCRHELETASHDLRILFALPRAPRQPGNVPKVLAFPFDSLTPEQHEVARTADGLLFDAYMGLFGGESSKRRSHYGTTTVSPIVCKQLREGVALLNGLFETETIERKSETEPPRQKPDGPIGKSGFRWHEKEKTGLRPDAFQLVSHLWKAIDRTSTWDDLAEPVFDEHEGDYVTSDRLGSVRRDANNFFQNNGFPFKVKLSVKLRKAELEQMPE